MLSAVLLCVTVFSFVLSHLGCSCGVFMLISNVGLLVFLNVVVSCAVSLSLCCAIILNLVGSYEFGALLR